MMISAAVNQAASTTMMTSFRIATPKPAHAFVPIASSAPLSGDPASPFADDVPQDVEHDLAHVQDRIACLEAALQHLDGGDAPDPKARASLVASHDPRDSEAGALCARSTRLLHTFKLGHRIESVLDGAFLPASLFSIAMGGTFALIFLGAYAATVFFSLDGAHRAETALGPCSEDLERMLEEERRQRELLTTVRDTREAYQEAGTIDTHEDLVEIGPVKVPRRRHTSPS